MRRDDMAPELLTLNPTEDARVELKSYNETIPMGSLAIGVDNIHHDVFLSPKFVQSAKDYLFDLIKQGTKAKYFPGIELRPRRLLCPRRSSAPARRVHLASIRRSFRL